MLAKMTISVGDRLENIVEKGENTVYPHFLLSHHMNAFKGVYNQLVIFDM